MKTLLSKIASILAFVIGGMAIVAGGRVLLGNDPGYYVIDWVPVYNFTMGVISLIVTAILIWKNSRYALPAAVITFAAHSAVMLVLQTAYRQVVAAESIQAMTIRMVTWAVILVLMIVQARREKAAAPGRLTVSSQ